MPKYLALTLCLAAIAWLFYRDRSIRPMASGALWLVLAWIFIIGSRPVSHWLGIEIAIERPVQYLDGSPFDRNLFLLLMAGGLAALAGRGVAWNRLIAENTWLFLFLCYCLVSVLWSDYAFVSFKRWIKEIGTVIMVLIIMTEKDPAAAARAVLARFTYLALPLSVLVIKYFPDIGRYYNNFTWKAAAGGITTNKNTLGSVLIICTVFLAWEAIEARKAKQKDNQGSIIRFALFLMVLWLLMIADSSTAVVCSALGASLMIAARFPVFKRQVRRLGTWGALLGLTAVLLFSFPGIIASIVGLLGRDATFTGRTELWSELLKVPLNPLIGKGYQGFWLGETIERMWQIFQFRPNQAHNGYLEVYLNMGLVGLGLLLAIIARAGKKLKRDMLNNDNFGVFRFSILFISLLYNWTEATFSGMNLIWMSVLIAAVRSPAPMERAVDTRKEPLFARHFRTTDRDEAVTALKNA